MDRAGPAQMDRARHLLAHEAAAPHATGSTAAGRVYDKLLAQMAPLVGDAGVHLLFVRSAKLARGEFDFVGEGASAEGSQKLRQRLGAQDPAVSIEAAATLFGNLFTLMTAFVGERLTNQVLRGAWPKFEETALWETHK